MYHMCRPEQNNFFNCLVLYLKWSLDATVKLLYCNLEVTSLSPENSLLQNKVKLRTIDLSPELRMALLVLYLKSSCKNLTLFGRYKNRIWHSNYESLLNGSEENFREKLLFHCAISKYLLVNCSEN